MLKFYYAEAVLHNFINYEKLSQRKILFFVEFVSVIYNFWFLFYVIPTETNEARESEVEESTNKYS